MAKRRVEIELEVSTSRAKAELAALEERADRLDQEVSQQARRQTVGGTRGSGYSDARRGIHIGNDASGHSVPISALTGGVVASMIAAREPLDLRTRARSRSEARRLLAAGNMNGAAIAAAQSTTGRPLPNNLSKALKNPRVRAALSVFSATMGAPVADQVRAASRIAGSWISRTRFTSISNKMYGIRVGGLAAFQKWSQSIKEMTSKALAPRKSGVAAKTLGRAIQPAARALRGAQSLLTGSLSGFLEAAAPLGRGARGVAIGALAVAGLSAAFSAKGTRERLEDLAQGGAAGYWGGIFQRMGDAAKGFIENGIYAATRFLIEFTPGSTPQQRLAQQYELEKMVKADAITAAKAKADQHLEVAAGELAEQYSKAGWNRPKGKIRGDVLRIAQKQAYDRIEREIIGMDPPHLMQTGKQDK